VLRKLRQLRSGPGSRWTPATSSPPGSTSGPRRGTRQLVGARIESDGRGSTRCGRSTLNDAKAPLGSHLDRHENIGKGELGTPGFAHLVSDPRWENVPGYLETPLDDRGYDRYAEDLALLRTLVASVPVAKTSVRRPRAPKKGDEA
jgi:hypothetical protein